MEQKLRALYLALLMAALLYIPAYASELEIPPEPDVSVEDSQDGIFQCGADYGPQTIPGQAELMDDREKEIADFLTAKWKEGWDTLKNTPLTEETFYFADISELNIYYPNTDAPGDVKAEYETFMTIRSQIINDDPERFFYSNGYSLENKSETDKWFGSYEKDKGSWPIRYIKLKYVDFDGLTGGEADARFYAAIDKALAAANGITDRVEQILVLHDYLCLNANYNYERSHDLPAPTRRIYRAYGALVDGDPVCNGYTLAYQVLLNRLNIPNTYVVSNPDSTGMTHSWNLVEIDGAYYHIDTTWDDGQDGRCHYPYFLLSDETFKAKHTPYNSWSIPLPAADSKKYESGWIFSGSESSVYRHDGKYYAVKSYNNISVSSRLDSEGTNLVISGQPYRNIRTGYGVVWLDGFLYYIYWDTSSQVQTLFAFHLDSGKCVQVGQFDCKGSTSIGLRYENGCIIPSNGNLKGHPVLAAPGIPVLPQQTSASPVIAGVNDRFPAYYYNHRFYTVITEMDGIYVKKLTVSASGDLGSGGTNPDVKGRNLQLYPSRGVVWHDGYLYYIDWGHADLEILMAFQLETGKIIQVGQFDSQGSGFSLRYDEAEGCITAYRSGTDLARFAVLPPVSATSAGIAVFDNGNAAYAQADLKAGQKLWVAHYNGGRMTSLRQETLLQPDTYWYFGELELDAMVIPLREGSGQVRVFLLDSHYAPVCPAA